VAVTTGYTTQTIAETKLRLFYVIERPGYLSEFSHTVPYSRC